MTLNSPMDLRLGEYKVLNYPISRTWILQYVSRVHDENNWKILMLDTVVYRQKSEFFEIKRRR